MTKHINYKKKTCSNCGILGHGCRFCKQPKTSFGVININIIDNVDEMIRLKTTYSHKDEPCYRITSRIYPQIVCTIPDIKENDINYQLVYDKIICKNENDMRKFCYYHDKISFMMVSRKFSLGFVEFIRGNYDVLDNDSIINLFRQMYESEITLIGSNVYDDLLYYFLNRQNTPKQQLLTEIYEGKYYREYCQAKIKFNVLKDASKTNDSISDNNMYMNDQSLPLSWYVEKIKPKWPGPEWGFPKGRRDRRSEENLACACREFEEETGFSNHHYSILDKIEPIEENLIGTDKTNYRHIYYLAINNNPELTSDDYDKNEIGQIKWFNYTEAIAKIRPYHHNKLHILTRIYVFILNELISK